MAKVVFEFKNQDDMDAWLGYWYDGGGDQEMYNCFDQNGEEYPEIKITEEQ